MISTTDMASTAASTVQTSERRCENADCNVNKLISMVPKRKTTQFIAEPVVMDKPMLVNGFTAVFQVDGTSAKLMDIKNPSGETHAKPIYRIVPNSHVHVVNYVVIDTDEAYLKKITENDPATMQKLLSSQKESADQMLKKIMSGQGSSATAAMTTVVSTVNPNNGNVPTTQNSSTMPVTTQTNITKNPTPVGVPPSQVAVSNTAPKASIKLPVRMHPNLKITAVACAESVNSSAMPTNIAAPAPGSPYITPIPLTNLQTPPTAIQSPKATPSINSMLSASSTAGDSVDKPTYDKMHNDFV